MCTWMRYRKQSQFLYATILLMWACICQTLQGQSWASRLGKCWDSYFIMFYVCVAAACASWLFLSCQLSVVFLFSAKLPPNPSDLTKKMTALLAEIEDYETWVVCLSCPFCVCSCSCVILWALPAVGIMQSLQAQQNRFFATHQPLLHMKERSW